MADIDIGKILEALNSKADVDLNNAQKPIKVNGTLATSPAETEARIQAGSTTENGALIALYGSNSTVAPNSFLVRAADGSKVMNLLGTASGSLKWNGYEVVRQQASSNGVNGYIKLNSGIIIQWGHVDSSATEYIKVTFPVPFWGYYAITKNYPSNQTAAVQYRELGFYEKTATGATAFNQAGVGSGFDWIAIGY